MNDITYKADSSEENGPVTIVGYGPTGAYIVKSKAGADELLQLSANSLFMIHGCNETSTTCIDDKMYYPLEGVNVVVVGFHKGKSILIRVDEGQYKNELAALPANALIREAPFK